MARRAMIVSRQSIDRRGRTAEQLSLVFRRAAGRQPFECVPHHGVAEHALVDWKVALKHATLRSEKLDASFDIRPPRVREHDRGWWQRVLIEREATYPHSKPAELQIHVRMFSQLCQA